MVRNSEVQEQESDRARHQTRPTHQTLNLKRRETLLRLRYSAGKKAVRTRMMVKTRKEDRASKIHLPRTTSSARAIKAESTRNSDQFSSKVKRNIRLLPSAVKKAKCPKYTQRTIKGITIKLAEGNRRRLVRVEIRNKIYTTQKTFLILFSHRA